MVALDVFPIDWVARDVRGAYTITMFGRTRGGEAVAVHIPYFPYFYLEAPAGVDDMAARAFRDAALEATGADPGFAAFSSVKSMWGFTDSALIRVLCLAFKSKYQRRKAAEKLGGGQRTVYESSVDPLLRFFHGRDIGPAQWVRVTGCAPVPAKAKATRCPLEYTAAHTSVAPAPAEVRDRPRLLIVSWDGEMYSHARRFPRASEPLDHIIQLAASFQYYGEPIHRQVVFCLRETDEDAVPGVDIRWFDDEHDLINAFLDAVADADVLVGYNTDAFDWPYVHGRTSVLVDDETGESLVDMAKLGKMVAGGGVVSAYGGRTTTPATPGALQLDLITWMRKEHKLESYSLNSVSAAFLGDAKLDMTAGDIFDKFEKGTPADRAAIAAYAAKDTELPLRLLDKLCILESLLEMASATCVPIDDVVRRGQQVRVYSVLMRKARAMGFVCPDGAGIPIDGKFQGATVLDPSPGAYFDIVSGLDFASLYPSIIRAHTMCYSSIVLDPAYDNLPGVQYYEVATDLGTFRYAQTRDAVVPALLADLAAYRKAAKNKMAASLEAGDAFAVALHDGAQRAFKTTANSAYGFLGAGHGFLPCAPIAASVTATGRSMIQQTKLAVERLHPGSRVVYGDTDSVMVILALGEAKRHDMEAHFEAARAVTRTISEQFPDPIELEFEKCYLPYLLFCKKRYAGLMYTRPHESDKVDVKGLQLVRRDHPQFVKTACSAILHKILYDRSPEMAMEVARRALVDVLRGAVPLADFVMSKQMKAAADYANQASQPHLAVARSVYRETGQVLQPGSRVPFVYASRGGGGGGLLADTACHPDHFEGKQLNLEYYATALTSAMRPLLEHVVDKQRLDDLVFQHPDVVDLLRELRNRNARQAPITRFFPPAPPGPAQDGKRRISAPPGPAAKK
jgi:DNA polymerase delta subunit 1